MLGRSYTESSLDLNDFSISHHVSEAIPCFDTQHEVNFHHHEWDSNQPEDEPSPDRNDAKKSRHPNRRISNCRIPPGRRLFGGRAPDLKLHQSLADALSTKIPK